MSIGLALSGGGMRAIAFHAGVLRRLAAGQLLESVSRISTVSGGSIFVAGILARGERRWPSSEDYLQRTYGEIRELVTTTSILSWSVVARAPSQWLKLPANRARLLAHLLEKRWGIGGRLTDLPPAPEWIINTTCYETGKNWRFARKEMGDWVFGRHFAPDFRVADVAAASAAVPYAIGALRFPLPADGWYHVFGRTHATGERKDPPGRSVHLWDGGAYENLGLEPLYKVETGASGCERIFVSDASGPVPQGKRSVLKALLAGNLPSPKLFDIASDQIRSLRSRMLVDAFQRNAVRGAVFRMGNSVRDIDLKSGAQRQHYGDYLDEEDTQAALRYPTTLAAIDPKSFELLARHGFELADATLGAYCPDIAAERRKWSIT